MNYPKLEPGTVVQVARPLVWCPFEIVVDTREQNPFMFDYPFRFLSPSKKGGEPAGTLIPTRRLTLPVGDYSILGMPGIAIERKSKADLFGSVARRANFIGRLERMSELTYSAVVVEADYLDCLTNPPPFSGFHPRSLSRTVIAWRQRYPVDWYFVGGREAAEVLTYRILERFYIDHKCDYAHELTP